MAFQSQPLIRELLCNAASGSPLWARVGARTIPSAAATTEQALRTALTRSGGAIQPELACSTYVVTCVY
ncbi:hypothetical protein [Propionivibrio sp.]|uniref:hypothetical protein n=1 Tax=Propionivibrio sp. TaxID=2212460 RepID=UPI003BF438B9